MVSAFSSGVAALDSDAGTIARDALTRATQLVPEEPAAWADLGLAHIRLGDLEAAARVLEKARTLAPESGRIERLLALLEERRGRFAESIGHLKRAIELDPKDLKSRYALVRELERQGGAEAEAEALRILGQILQADPDNLAAMLDQARLAAKAGDSEALAEAVRQLGERSASWPDRVREQLRSLEQAAGGTNLRPVITRVIVLRNVLLTVPAFRQDIDALMLPVGTVGEPLPRFLRLAVPSPTPAPPDESIAFAVETLGRSSPRKADALFLLADAKGGPAIPLEADGRELRKADGSGAIATFPGGPSATPPSPRGVAVADWNSDYRLDLVLAGAGGVRFLRQKEDGSFEDVTAATGLGPEVLGVDAFGVWAADIELDGDLDFVVGVRAGPTIVLRNNGDGTFEAPPPFAAVSNLRDFAWADLDHDGDPDAAFLDDKGTLTVFDNERSGQFRARPVPGDLGARVAIAIADLDGDGAMDLLLLGTGAIHRLSDREDGRSWDVAEVARWSDRPGGDEGTPRAGEPRLFAADLDNNGGIDLLGSTSGGRLGSGSAMRREGSAPWPRRRGSGSSPSPT